MKELYEREADAGADVDDEKPTWDDDIDIGDIVPPSENADDDHTEASSSKKKKRKKRKGGENDVDTAGVDIDDMDAEVERPRAEDGEWDGSEEMRKRALEKYMDELYELEFNDLVGIPSIPLLVLLLIERSRLATFLHDSNMPTSLLKLSGFPHPRSSWLRMQS